MNCNIAYIRYNKLLLDLHLTKRAITNNDIDELLVQSTHLRLKEKHDMYKGSW